MFRALPSLPSKQNSYDPHEKPGRYIPASRNRGKGLASMSDSWASQPQRMRWLKVGTIVFAVICLFYWFSPAGLQVYKDGLLICCDVQRRKRALIC